MPAAERPKRRVTLSFDNGKDFKIPSGFKYVNPQNDDMRRAYFTGKSNEKKAQ